MDTFKYSTRQCLLHMGFHGLLTLVFGLLYFVSFFLWSAIFQLKLYVALLGLAVSFYFYYIQNHLTLAIIIICSIFVSAFTLYIMQKCTLNFYYFCYSKFLTWKSRQKGDNIEYVLKPRQERHKNKTTKTFSFQKPHPFPKEDDMNPQPGKSTHSDTSHGNTKFPASNTDKISMDFFAGTTTPESRKKRFHELLKIYHPDNASGDNEMIQEIMKQYKEKKNEQ